MGFPVWLKISGSADESREEAHFSQPGLGLLLPTFFSSNPLSVSVTLLPYIETVSENKNSLWGRMTQVFGSGIREHFTFRGERLRAPTAKPLSGSPHWRPPPAVLVCSSKHATRTHNKPLIKADFGSKFEKSKVATWNWVCLCVRKRASQTITANALLTHPPHLVAGAGAQIREETLSTSFLVASPE